MTKNAVKEETCSLTIKGLDCAACAEKIEKVLMRHEGVRSVSVYLGAERVDVRFASPATDRAAIIKIINDIGYKVVTDEEKNSPGLAGKKEFPRMGIVLFFLLLGLSGARLPGLPFFDLWDIIAVVIGGYPLLKTAIIDLRERSVTAEVFMAVGVIAAAAIGEFRSAAIISFFMLIAGFLDSFTLEKSRSAIRELINMAPKTARVRKDDREIEIPVEEVVKGDLVVVKPGEKIPVEGIIVSGRGFINQAPITGESQPVEKTEGENVYAATVNQHGILFIRVTHTGEDTTYAHIIRLVEKAESSKARVQKVADKFAAYFTPSILAAAVLTLLLTGKLTNAIAVIVVACPCTVAIATPLAVVAGMGKAARRGIIIKGGKYLEALAKVDTLVMDKTGTLTIGDPVVTDIKGFSGHSDEEIICLTAGTERYSEHPLAKAVLKRAADMNITVPEPEQCRVLPGKGVEALVLGRRTLLGNRNLLKDREVRLSDEIRDYVLLRENEGKTALLLAVDSVISGVISVADIVREGTREAMDELRGLGFNEPVMLTGDNQRTANAIAAALGIRHVMSRLLPEDKVAKVKELTAEGKKVLMVGDGINDAPALAQAHVGVAMGAMGSDAAIEAADVALMRDEWKHIPEAVRIGRDTFSVIKQNLALGIAFNIIGITLASTGILTPAMAAVAHVMPDVLVFLNSSRLLK